MNEQDGEVASLMAFLRSEGGGDVENTNEARARDDREDDSHSEK
jgi:hypothetical protein